MDGSGTLEPLKGQPDGPFHLRHAKHTRVVKGEVGTLVCIYAPFSLTRFPHAQDIMFIEAMHQVRRLG